MTDDDGQEDEQPAAWYAALAGDLGPLAHELADESTAAMREVLAAEDAEQRAAYQRYQHQLAAGR